MKKFYLLPIFASIIIILIAIGHFTFPIMSVMLICWFSIAAFVKVKNFDKRLSRSERKLFFITIILYPIIETVIKYLLVNDIIPYSWFWINRVEHFLSAIAIEILFYPFLKPTLSKLNKIESFIFIVCVVVFIGNLNEFFEYLIRHILNTYRLDFYYWDTIYDMVMNILGAALGFCILKSVK